jgi:hypothetical protein
LQKNLTKDLNTVEEEANRLRVKELVSEVESDFKERQKERFHFERQWELNMNFFAGNQYCDLNSRGELVAEGKTFYWQRKGVFNHVAPLIESRIAKFSRVSPTVSVRPESDDDKDVAAAALAEKLISCAFKRTEVEKAIKITTGWSETCGTGFYKVVWDNQGGNLVGEVDGEKIYEGDVRVFPVSPFEIFPDSLYANGLDECKSIIHARAVPVMDIKEKYGKVLEGRAIGIYNLVSSGTKQSQKNTDGIIKDAVVVIERYEKSSENFPNGRLVTVAGGELLYEGELPYINGENGERGFPFVRQISQPLAGSFFGTSIIERLIPVQRAYNAVKNRKHEFLNRLSMGIMTVEDGSVDLEDLEEEGLSPGKVLVYRQGSKAPELMENTTMPDDFNTEEEKLLNEFVIVSGVSDVSSSSDNASLNSGSALELLVEQDNARLLTAAEEIRNCYLDIARLIIRLFAQFTVGGRTVKVIDEHGKLSTYYADEKAVACDDVYLESENELLYTHRQKKDMIFKLYESGLLTDEDGKLRTVTKEKILSLLGYKDLDYQKGMARLQEEKAQKENERLKKQEKEVEEIDDDGIHVDEHTRFVLCEYDTLTKEQKNRFFAHIKAHKERINLTEGEI